MNSRFFCLIAVVSAIRLNNKMEITVTENPFPEYLEQPSLNQAQKAATKLVRTIDLAASHVEQAYGDDSLIEMNNQLISTFKQWSKIYDAAAHQYFQSKGFLFSRSFLQTIQNSLSSETDGSASGSEFIMNNEWVLKTEKIEFIEELKKITPQYVQHIAAHPETLIAPMVMVVKVNDKYWTVMRNINSRATQNVRRYDLKAARPVRKSHSTKYVGLDGQLGFLGDWMVEYGEFTFDDDADKNWLLEKLAFDFSFFTRNWEVAQLVDYSIMAFVQDRPAHFTQRTGNMIPIQHPTRGPQVLVVGIIDFLAPLDKYKIAQSKWEFKVLGKWSVIQEERFTKNYAKNLNTLARCVFNPSHAMNLYPAETQRLEFYKQEAIKEMQKKNVMHNGMKMKQNEAVFHNNIDQSQMWAPIVTKGAGGKDNVPMMNKEDYFDPENLMMVKGGIFHGYEDVARTGFGVDKTAVQNRRKAFAEEDSDEVINDMFRTGDEVNDMMEQMKKFE